MLSTYHHSRAVSASCRSNVWPPPEMLADAFGPLEAAWPLYYESDRRTRFAYAIFALNKVL